MRVVFDTNIFISAFVIPGGNAEEAYLHAVGGRFELFTSISILTETANTLRTKFVWWEDKVLRLSTGDRIDNGLLFNEQGDEIEADSPLQVFTRWYGFSLTFPATEVYGGS